MIIPIRCFTCGKLIADKWEYFVEEVDKMENNNKEDPKSSKPVTKNFDDHTKEAILDKLGLTRICCRRHMLGHVDL
jgi:DNA-directed RNA polymerase subunit N